MACAVTMPVLDHDSKLEGIKGEARELDFSH